MARKWTKTITGRKVYILDPEFDGWWYALGMDEKGEFVVLFTVSDLYYESTYQEGVNFDYGVGW